MEQSSWESGRPVPARGSRRTVVGYFGSKARLASRIVGLLPSHRSYIEPFAGSLAVLMAKPRSAGLEVANDIDGDLMTFWRVLRDQPDELMRVCALTPHSRAEHAAAWPIPPTLPDVERARRVWVRLTQGRGGHLRRTGWRHHQVSGGRSMPFTLAGYVDRFGFAAERLAGVSLECLPALEVIGKYGRDDHALLYVDPPYLGQTRSAHVYRHEMTDETAHRSLADALHSCEASVVLSGYPCSLYDDLYRGWARVELNAYTGQANTTRENGRRVEVLWGNRPFTTPGETR